MFGFNIVFDLELLLRVVGATIVILLAYYVGRVLERYIKRARIQAPPEIIENVSRTAKILVLFIGILVALSILKIDLTGFILAAGFAGIVVGLAAQQTLSHFFAGVALMLEGRLKIGDAVKVDGDYGIVEAVGLLSTRIRLFSGEVLTIPNGLLMSSKLYNYTPAIARRIDIAIGISYESSIEKALDVIKQVLWDKELVLAEPQPMVIVDSLSDSSIVVKAVFWTPSSHYWDVRKEIIREIKEALEKEGIEIPYPQRVVRLRHESK